MYRNNWDFYCYVYNLIYDSLLELGKRKKNRIKIEFCSSIVNDLKNIIFRFGMDSWSDKKIKKFLEKCFVENITEILSSYYIESYYNSKQKKELKKKNELIGEINNLYDIEDHYEEYGYQTIGHICVSNEENEILKTNNIDPLYGEISYFGLITAGKNECLNLNNSSIVYDFGMGVGKLILMIYNMFPTINVIEGFEISESRFNICKTIMDKYDKIKLLNYKNTNFNNTLSYKSETYEYAQDKRRIIINKMSIFDIPEEKLKTVTSLFFNVNISYKDKIYDTLKKLSNGCRILSYVNYDEFDFLDINPFNERIFTSWAIIKGHKFNYYIVNHNKNAS